MGFTKQLFECEKLKLEVGFFPPGIDQEDSQTLDSTFFMFIRANAAYSSQKVVQSLRTLQTNS
jgi:hypothetical protein